MYATEQIQNLILDILYISIWILDVYLLRLEQVRLSPFTVYSVHSSFHLNPAFVTAPSCKLQKTRIANFIPRNILLNIVTRWSDYRRGFGLDDWIYFTLYIHTTRDYRQYSAYNLQFIVKHSLEFCLH
jgi:hypothetical protein